LSPDGSLFIYFASKYGRSPFATWTAISRPPYFTALALWPLGDSWSGGGLFVDAQTLLLNHYPIEPPEGHKVSLPPRWLKVKMYRTELGEEYESPLRKRLLRDGWTILQKEVKLPDPHWWRFKLLEPEIIEKRRPDGRYVLLKKYFGGGRHPDGLQYTYKFFLKNIMSGQETLLEGVTWADLDHRQRLVFTKNDGCLYADELQSAEFSPRLIADLNSQCPGAVSTPEWATIWEKQGSQG
jgi:hypothetical protein